MITELGSLGPPPAAVHPDSLLGPHSVAARLMLNPLTLLGGPRALLLQLAHPLVAAGVADHSNIRDAPFDRLLRTLSALATIAFADPDRSQLALDALAHTHQSVRGRSPQGRAYSAGDPRLATWVHATIIDSYLVIERRWLGLLSDSDREQFYRELLGLGRAFGAREASTGSLPSADALPGTLSEFEPWMREGMAGLRVSDQARAMARDVMRPPLSAPWGWAGLQAERLIWPFMEVVTADLLPEHLRSAYRLAQRRGAVARCRRTLLGTTSAVVRRVAPISERLDSRPDRPTRVAAALSGSRLSRSVDRPRHAAA